MKFGDIVDCVDINKQPAFNHPLLKNHKLQVLRYDQFVNRSLKLVTKLISEKPISNSFAK